MKAERLKALESLFFAAQECPPEERAAYLQQQCGEDAALQEELLQLLAASDRAEQQPTLPAIAVVAQQIAQESAALPALEHYEVLQELGRGGMGEVVLARDKRLHRKVALKFLSPAFAADHERRRRFEQEARLASALNHQNILTIYEIAAVNGTYFMATEFVEGETLRQRLKHAPLPETEAVNIAVQIAAALQAAHAKGIIHRDIKPENIMVRPDGQVKVLDFGIAKLTDPHIIGANANTVGIQTATGQIVGTPAYLAPEQLRGRKLDGRSDLFSLGVVLYEMLVGMQPFTGATIAEVLGAILHKEIELPAGPKHSPALAAILTKALRKAPEERFQTAAEFSAALLQTQAGAPTQHKINQETMADPVPIKPPVRKLHWGIALLVMLVLVGTASYQAWRNATSLPPHAAQPKPTIELMRYSVEISSPDAASEFTDGTQPIPAKKDFKFHFTPQKSGYLYIVAPGERNVLQTFLTAQPTKKTGNISHQLIANLPFEFPAGKDSWLGLNETLATTFTIIFSAVPLRQPAFFAAPVGHELTIPEQEELDGFKQRFGVITPKNMEDAKPLRVPAQMIAAPTNEREVIIFEVTLRRK